MRPWVKDRVTDRIAWVAAWRALNVQVKDAAGNLCLSTS